MSADIAGNRPFGTSHLKSAIIFDGRDLVKVLESFEIWGFQLKSPDLDHHLGDE